jgi:putative protease
MEPHAVIPSRPELLAPAGDLDCARAAVENGADAVYFGLRSGLNARARAVNFSPDELPELIRLLHLRGVRGYLTLNTLVFPDEIESLAEAVRTAVATGVDAVLVQDLGAVRMIRTVAPDLPLHASTQMSLTSAEGIRVAESLGICRVVLARELSIDEIRRIGQETRVELEVFVHGALCMSYSGQCLASFAMGGRSGNRGQCAQACRLPYEMMRDVRRVELGDRKFLLSPLDLAAYDLLPELIAAGVAAVKIEGRLKSAEYVAGTVRQYRRAIDEAAAGRRVRLSPEDLEELEGSFSRGFSHGWLEGHDDLRLVPGRSSAKRGVCVGRVHAVRGSRVSIVLAGPIQRGDGVVFDVDNSGSQPQGGRVYEVFVGKQSVADRVTSGLVELAFGRQSLDLGQLHPGQKVLKTDDPRLDRRLRKTYDASQPQRRVPLDLAIEAGVGRPLRILAQTDSGSTCRIESADVLEEAVQHPLTPELLRQQFGRLGKTVYQLRDLDARIDGRPMARLSLLGQLRHEMIRLLDAAAMGPAVGQAICLAKLPAQVPGVGPVANVPQVANVGPDAIVWHVLCREPAQIESVLNSGVLSVMADFTDIDRYADAVRLARQHHAQILLATPRIQKPGEAEVFSRIAAHRPEGMLVRNLAGAAFCAEQRIPFVADASLHATNAWTVGVLRDLGAERITAAADLETPRLLAWVQSAPTAWLEVIVYQHLPMFHTEHCLFCAAMVPHADRSKCGQPCRRHDVRLRDRLGVEHPLRADAFCRNTIFHAEPRSLMSQVAELRRLGVRHFRVELLDGLPHGAILRQIAR